MRYLVLIILLLNFSNAQYLYLSNIDTTNFPEISADIILLDADGELQSNLDPADFKIVENGLAREILSINCPVNNLFKKLSSVIVIDQSGSMLSWGLDLAKEAATSWINAIPDNGSKCALVGFNYNNNLYQDFTSEKSRLIEKLELIQAEGGTDFNKGLIDKLASGLEISKKGRGEKLIVFITDGFAPTPNLQEIINNAKAQNCKIFSVTLGLDCPENLRTISEETGGAWFEDVTSLAQAQNILYTIYLEEYLSSNCKIKWRSNYQCTDGNYRLNITNSKFNVEYNLVSKLQLPKIEVEYSDNNILFNEYDIGNTIEKTLLLTALNKDIQISNVESSNPDFTVFPNSFELLAGEEIELTVSYLPKSDSYEFSEFTFESNYCNLTSYAIAIKPNINNTEKTLKITHPNGDELFFAESDTLIQWEGISKLDEVTLEFSSDNGEKWNKISQNASNNKFRWSKLPKLESDSCLLRVRQNSKYGTSLNEIWRDRFSNGTNNIIFDIISTDNDDGASLLLGSSSDGIELIKIDYLGSEIWRKEVIESGISAREIIEDKLGNFYIIAGDGTEVIVAYVDPNGEKIWEKEIIEGNPESISLDPNGNLYLASKFRNTSNLENSRITKIDSDGSIIWNENFNFSNNYVISKILATNDGMIFTGYFLPNESNLNNNGRYDVMVGKIDFNGNLLWQKNYGGSKEDLAYSLVAGDQNNYLILGYTSSDDNDVNENRGASDIWLLNLDQNGNVIWEKTYGGSLTDIGNDIVRSKDGNFIIAGSTLSIDGDVNSTDPNIKGYIIKISKDGDILYSAVAETIQNVFFSANEAIDAGIIGVGTSSSNYFYAKYQLETNYIQSDTTDNVFTIVDPEISYFNIGMLDVPINNIKDSLVVGVITNFSSYPITIDNIRINSGDVNEFFIPQGLKEFKLEPGEEKDLTFSFKPLSAGFKRAFATIYSETLGTREDIIEITGNGIESNLQLRTPFVDFGLLNIIETKDILIETTLENVGDATVTIYNISENYLNQNDFEILEGDNTFTLDPNESHSMELRFSPSDIGRSTGFINFYYDEEFEPLKMQLLGNVLSEYYSQITIPSYTQEAGEEFEITLQMSDSEYMDIQGAPRDFEAEISYNGSILYFPNGDCDDNFNCNATFNGTWDGISENIISIPAIATLGNTESTDIKIERFKWVGGDLPTEVDLVDGSLTIDGICEEGPVRLVQYGDVSFSMTSRPQPFEDELTIQIGMRETLTFDLLLLDINGNEIRKLLENETLEQGSYSFNIDTSDLTTGVYYIRLISNKGQLLNKIIKE